MFLLLESELPGLIPGNFFILQLVSLNTEIEIHSPEFKYILYAEELSAGIKEMKWKKYRQLTGQAI
jgi:hypothetical protein